MAKSRKQSASGQNGPRTTSAASDISMKKKNPSPQQHETLEQPETRERETEAENFETASVAESDAGKADRVGTTTTPAIDEDDGQEVYHEPSLTDIIVSHYDGNRGPTGLYDGYGEAHFASGNLYKGNFEKGQMQGKGIYTWNNGIRYEGDFLNNHITGYGIYKWPDASSYEGEVADGLRHGVGVFRSPQQALSFSGQWYLGQRHGRGMMSYGEQSWYEGDWVNNARHGYGIRRYKTGNVYEGHWTNDKRHGEGTMRWIATNETYRGMWENGVQHGYGTHTWYLQRVPGSQYPLRNEYVGEFVNGLRHGRGKFLYASGAVYDGEWENGRKSGWGKFIFNNGRVFEGQLDNDHMVDYPNIETCGTETPNLLQLPGRTQATVKNQDVCSDSLDVGTTQASGSSLKLNIDSLLEQFPESERSDELKHVTYLILRNIALLKRVYTFYSALGHDQSLDNTFIMTRFQFWRFLKDCEIHHTQKSLVAMDRAIANCHPVNDLHNPMEKMLMREFLSNVIVLSHFLFKNEVQSLYRTNEDRNVLALCLEKLLSRHISKHACTVKGNFLSEQRRAMTALGYMDKCWQIYVALGTPNVDPPNDMVIKMRHFLFTLQDLGIVSSLPASKIVEVLRRDDPNVSTEGICNLELDMTFLEFFEALIGCAVEIDYKSEQTHGDGTHNGSLRRHSSHTETLSHRQNDSQESPTRSLSVISRVSQENQSVHQQNSSMLHVKHSSTFDGQKMRSTSEKDSKENIGPTGTGALLQTLSLMSAKERGEAATNQDEVASEVSEDQASQMPATKEEQEYNEWANKLQYFFIVKLFPAWDHIVNLKNEAKEIRKERNEKMRLQAIEEEMERRKQNLQESQKVPEETINAIKDDSVDLETTVPEGGTVPELSHSTSSVTKTAKHKRK